jgi:hypothetical protein
LAGPAAVCGAIIAGLASSCHGNVAIVGGLSRNAGQINLANLFRKNLNLLVYYLDQC